jgi:hypothetical protein
VTPSTRPPAEEHELTARCEDDHCVTCADEGVAMQVVGSARDGIARCRDGNGAVTDVMTDLVGAVAPGETVLVHAGVALARMEAGAT